MPFSVALQSELLKTKRTASFWLSIAGAALIPLIFTLVYIFNPDGVAPGMETRAWEQHFMRGWQSLAAFLLPMYIILICALIPQIEFKNNTWKQVFASPQSTAQIYFSKLVTVHLMILLCYLLFNLLMLAAGAIADLGSSQFKFFENPVPWKSLLALNLRTYLSVLGIAALQYWLSLRFKNFVAPVGIGLALLIASLIAFGFQWKHAGKLPYAHPSLTLQSIMKEQSFTLATHEWWAIGFFVLFTGAGFLDLLLRKEKG